jgi:sterol desaturase/sphingolipid hydroxylase (fatty acid hydroxylase superfamily)
MMSSSSFAPQKTAGGIRRALEARKARRRLYPVTAVYTLCSLTMLGFCLASEHRARGLLFYVAGYIVWTWVEYEVHRYVLHGRFADGPGVIQHFLHANFDHLHWEHHARPWDGNHVSGTLKDTGLFVAILLGLSLLFPSWTASLLIAGVIQAYILEEWVHHSVHFGRFKNRYFRYIRRHHLYHHSPRGSEAGYGLTNGFWDVVYRTRFSERVRRALYRKQPAPRPAALRRAA